MYVFLDESGIHLKSGHSVFVIVQVNDADLAAINRSIHGLEKEIGTIPFHWSKMRWEFRTKAFKMLSKQPFTFQVAVFNNPLRNADQSVHETIGRLLAGEEISRIYIDGVKSRAYASRLKVALRQSRVSTRKLTTVNDESFPGVRIADLLAGVYRHQLDKPSPESASLQALIAKKQQN